MNSDNIDVIHDDPDQVVPDDLDRDVYCLLGIPIDATGMTTVLRIIGAAARSKRTFFLSTPNLNFLVISQSDAEFRDSPLLSDLCPPDGMAIVCMARLLGIPITGTVAGSDIFDVLKSRPDTQPPLSVFLFGATEEVAAAAARQLNDAKTGLRCVGWLCPGFGGLAELDLNEFIERINESGADFLVAALGAAKGQKWLRRNYGRLKIPVRSHLGATINFQAGMVRRAPSLLQRLGFEWLWRIKEEPRLWRRYSHDGIVMLTLLARSVLPLAFAAWRLRAGRAGDGEDFSAEKEDGESIITVRTRRHCDRGTRLQGDPVLQARCCQTKTGRG